MDELARANDLCDKLSTVPLGCQEVPRCSARDLDVKLKIREALEGCRALLITDAIADWPAFSSWTLHELARRFGEAYVRVGLQPGGRPETMKLASFADYAAQDGGGDLEPRYVFEPRLRRPLTDDYDTTLGGLFPEDFLEPLGESTRPPHRWLCLGPRRSGSRPHVDPLHTSAWNALISGHKRWAVIDPKVIDKDISRTEVLAACGSASQSISDWFGDRLTAIRQRVPHAVMEAVQEPGEVMLVPAGLWHAVLNVTNTVAVTHNFVGSAEFSRAWKTTVQERPGLAREWLRKLHSTHPELASNAQEMGPFSGLEAADTADAPGGSRTPVPTPEAVGVSLWQQRLEGRRRLELPAALRRKTWDAASDHGCNGSGSARAARSFRKGEVVFVERALACAYQDETPHLALGLFEALPKTQTVSDLLAHWGLGRGSSPQEMLTKLAQHSSRTWCWTRDAVGNGRSDGLTLFASSGRVPHSWNPNLVRHVVGDCLIAIAAKDVREGDVWSESLTTWQFDEDARLAELQAHGHEGPEKDWPAGLPGKDSTQAAAATSLLARAERAAWSDSSEAHERALDQMKTLASDLERLPELRASAYLALRTSMMIMKLSTGLQRLDDAWDAAVRVLDLKQHFFAGDYAEAAIQLLLLGAGLAYLHSQASRAQELFQAAGGLVAFLLGTEDRRIGVPLWIKCFVPHPLQKASFLAWQKPLSAPQDEEEDASLPPGLGSNVASDAADARAVNNVDSWAEGSPESPDLADLSDRDLKELPQTVSPPEELSQRKSPGPADETSSSPAQRTHRAPAAQGTTSGARAELEGSSEAPSKGSREALARGSTPSPGRVVTTALGDVEISWVPTETAVVARLTLKDGVVPQDVEFEVGLDLLRLRQNEALIAEVPLPTSVDCEATPPAKFRKRQNQFARRRPE